MDGWRGTRGDDDCITSSSSINRICQKKTYSSNIINKSNNDSKSFPFS